MTTAARVVFRVAAGPQVGFGHLVRCRSLARAMNVEPLAIMRGTAQTRATAARMGWSVLDTGNDRALQLLNPTLMVIDDPSPDEASVWLRRGRRLGVPVATIHDLGVGHLDADLVIDGSVLVSGFGRVTPGRLRGPKFAILDPRISAVRSERRRPAPGRVLIALGGGEHVYAIAAPLSKAIAARVPAAEIRVARGFSFRRREPALAAARWVSAPDGLADELAQAQVAVVAGGVTLYEACALGVPVVAVAVTAAQHVTVRGAVCQGASIDGGRPPLDEAGIGRAADAVASLINNERLRRRQSRDARRMIDGLGAFRVADRLSRLIEEARSHAA